MPPVLKEPVGRPVLKDTLPEPICVGGLPFLSKALEWVVASQLQGIILVLEETDFLYPFQSFFRLRYGTGTALIALADDL